MPRPATQVPVEPGGQLVQPAAVGAVQPGAAVRLAGGEPHLAGEQQFTAAEEGDAGGTPFGEDAVVAAPRHVDAPHLAGGEAEAG